MTKEYDYLIIGAGLYGSICAYELQKRGFSCLVIEKRDHVGGNMYCEKINDINVHKYGAHIFHTNDERIWKYINNFVTFNNYRHSVIANYRNELYNLPFNMNTFSRLWNVVSPSEAHKIIETQRIYNTSKIKNLEEHALQTVGKDIYEKLIKGYTMKQWGRLPSQLPASILKRIPLKFTFNNDYFNDTFQGIPNGGYNKLFDQLLANVEVKLATDFFKEKIQLIALAKKVIYTGPIDAFYNFEYGHLDYRSLDFKHNILDCNNYQGTSVVNYTDINVPYTRIIEHKHFEFSNAPSTVITYEFPKTFEKNSEPYYPINDERNNRLYKQYEQKSKNDKNIIFGGRLAEYKYYDMHQIIAAALVKIKEETLKI
ncbi:UDP-galactopyranose mutase [Sphingobacterium sp.]|uniref:UDP-galactopyranose mutase n=1 Tax=Sphingobacterium sp. TaxID=341027 RepID=UPI00289A789B|nr:UDP-galactopyranose mutase [Sphingobacterium sp.]